MSEPINDLDLVLHEVNSKATSMKGAAALMRKATTKERSELLSLMAKHAKGLARLLARYQEAERRP